MGDVRDLGKVGNPALKIAVIYTILGALWIVASDNVLAWMAGDMNALTALQTYKGWVYVGVTAAIIFWLVRRDIRRLERTRASLRQSEEKFAKAFTAGPDCILITRLDDDKVMEANDRFFAATGYVHEEVLGKTAEQFRLWGHPEERTSYFAKFHRCGEVLDFETCFRHKDGTVVPYSISASPIDIGGEACVISIARSIAESKRAEAERRRLAAAIEQAAEYVVITDVATRIEYVNPSFEQITGLRRDEVLGRTIDLLRLEGDRSDFWQAFRAGSTWQGRVRHKSKEARAIQVDATVAPIREQGGTCTGYVVTCRDVTRESELESQLRQAQKMEAIGTLAGGIAHDFNNILSPILGYAELASEQFPANQDAKQCLAQIVSAAERARLLVRQILTFSRQTPHERKPMRMDSIVHEGLRFLRGTLPSTVELEEHVNHDVPLVFADATQIHQVLVNLCTNAFQAMKNDRGNITVGLTRVHMTAEEAYSFVDMKPGDYVCLSVADTGVGMDKSTLQRIFEPYFTTKGESGGTGLGLATVHGIVKSHEGVINVYSEPGKGTEFRVYFPTMSGEISDDSRVQQQLPRGHGECILVVDDEAAVLEVSSRILTHLGYEVVAFTEPFEAFKAFNATPDRFALLLTDRTMPRMTGNELAEQLLTTRPELPVILMTGFSAGSPAGISQDRAARRLITKPVSMVDLARTVHDALQGRALTH